MQGVRPWKFLSYSHLAWDNHGVFHKSQSEFCANYGTDGKYGRTYTQFLMRFVVSNGTTPFLQQFLLRFAKTRVAPSPPYSTLICRKTCDQLTTQLQPKSSCKRVFSDAVLSLHSIVSVVSSVLSPADTIPYSHYLTTDCVFLRPCQVFGDVRLQQNQILYHNGCE